MNQFFTQGLQHPFLTPSHLIILIGLGILIGQQGFKHIYNAVIAFIVAAILGAWTDGFYRITFNIEIVLLVISATIGILTALRLNLLLWIILLFSLSCGFLIGQDSAPVAIPGIKIAKIYTSLAGSILSSVLLLSLIAMIALLVKKLLQGIPLRILGSWVFASSIMVLAFQFSTK